MPGNFKKEDLRIIKTYKSMMNAMFTLLDRRNFNKITVNDLCEYAQISRSTFYTHFLDKYDLLQHWLKNLKSDFEKEDDTYIHVNKIFNDFIENKSRVIKNLLEDADDDTMKLIHEFMISLLNINIEKYENRQSGYTPMQMALSAFCAGGMVNLLLFQVKNKPENSNMVNSCFCDILKNLLEWNKIVND